MLFKRKEKEPDDFDFYFKVAGVTFDNDDGVNRQVILKSIANDIREQINPEYLYDGLRNKDIKADRMEHVYELEAWDDIPVDVLEGCFNDEVAYEVRYENDLIGFMPRDKIEDFQALLKKFKNYTTEARLIGGKTKSFDYDTEKVVLDTLDYGMVVHCKFSGRYNR